MPIYAKKNNFIIYFFPLNSVEWQSLPYFCISIILVFRFFFSVVTILFCIWTLEHANFPLFVIVLDVLCDLLICCCGLETSWQTFPHILSHFMYNFPWIFLQFQIFLSVFIWMGHVISSASCRVSWKRLNH